MSSAKWSVACWKAAKARLAEPERTKELTQKMVLMRSQWPHTVSDIVKSLDGVWGLVGATDTQGNLIRLERSLHEPLTYKVTEYDGVSEDKMVKEKIYQANEKEQAVKQFARALGFDGN